MPWRGAIAIQHGLACPMTAMENSWNQRCLDPNLSPPAPAGQSPSLPQPSLLICDEGGDIGTVGASWEEGRSTVCRARSALSEQEL